MGYACCLLCLTVAEMSLHQFAHCSESLTVGFDRCEDSSAGPSLVRLPARHCSDTCLHSWLKRSLAWGRRKVGVLVHFCLIVLSGLGWVQRGAAGTCSACTLAALTKTGSQALRASPESSHRRRRPGQDVPQTGCAARDTARRVRKLDVSAMLIHNVQLNQRMFTNGLCVAPTLSTKPQSQRSPVCRTLLHFTQ